jgi:hypothetical protein
MTTPRYVGFASRHPWTVRAAFVTSCLALLATSPGPGERPFAYRFEAEPIAVTTDLTPESPARVYRITLRAEALGVDGISSMVGLDQGAPTPFVAFMAYTEDQSATHTPVNVLTEISRPIGLEFTGDCATFDNANPCVAVVIVELSRTDNGASGGLVNIAWSVNLSAYANKPHGPDVGPLDLPWAVTLEEM